jgi:ankyrin repeat protein
MAIDTTIFSAIEQRQLDRLASLLRAGADPNAARPAEEGQRVLRPDWHALHAAIDALDDGGSVEALLLLLRHGAQVEGWGAGASHDTPLLMALFRHRLEAARILLAAGADPNVRGCEGDSPLRWAVEHDDIETAAMLLRCGAWKSMDEWGGLAGMTALGHAVSQLNVPMVWLLLSAGASVHALDSDYRPALKRIPPRDAHNAPAWDGVAALLASGQDAG